MDTHLHGCETIEQLKTGQGETLSLDHDLGIRPEGPDDTGYAVLAWLEREVGLGAGLIPCPSWGFIQRTHPLMTAC